jgi:hypothetical protein
MQDKALKRCLKKQMKDLEFENLQNKGWGSGNITITIQFKSTMNINGISNCFSYFE